MAELYEVQDVLGPRMRLGPRGVSERYYTVVAVSKQGVRFEIDLPDGEMDKEKVAKLLAAKAKALDDVRSL